MTELVIRIENNDLLPSLRKVITSLKGVKDAVLAKSQPAVSSTAARLLNDLAAFQSYKKGWDGENMGLTSINRRMMPWQNLHYVKITETI